MRLWLSGLLSLFVFSLHAIPQFQFNGLIDAGPTLYRIELVEDGSKTDVIDMYGVRGDATLLPIKDSGFAIKPTASYGRGDGDFISYGVGIGYYIPFCNERCYFVPTAGLNWTDLRTTLDLSGDRINSALPASLIFTDVREKFDSQSRYIGFDLMCQVCEPVWATFIYQYAWAKTDTVLLNDQFTTIGFPDGRIDSKGQSQGSNFGLAIDYYFCENVAATIAGGFNTSLDENRFGIRAYGVKFGIGYYFK